MDMLDGPGGEVTALESDDRVSLAMATRCDSFAHLPCSQPTVSQPVGSKLCTTQSHCHPSARGCGRVRWVGVRLGEIWCHAY